jgi:hypothetical protein
MMLRMIVLTRVLAGAAALAATPPVAVVEPRDDAFGLGHTAVPAAVTAPAAASAPASVEHVSSANPLWAIPLQQLSATRQRPLFAPSRRPPPPVVAYQLASAPPPPPPKPAEPEKPRLSLVGTIAAGAEGIGVFQDLASSGSVLRLKMGEGHDGWVLRAVQRREVTLQKGSQIAVLTLPLPEMNKIGLGSPGLGSPGLGSPGLGSAGPARPGLAPNRAQQGAFPAQAAPGNAAGASLSLPLSNASGLAPAQPAPLGFPTPVVPAATTANPMRDQQTNRR